MQDGRGRQRCRPNKDVSFAWGKKIQLQAVRHKNGAWFSPPSNLAFPTLTEREGVWCVPGGQSEGKKGKASHPIVPAHVQDLTLHFGEPLSARRSARTPGRATKPLPGIPPKAYYIRVQVPAFRVPPSAPSSPSPLASLQCVTGFPPSANFREGEATGTCLDASFRSLASVDGLERKKGSATLSSSGPLGGDSKSPVILQPCRRFESSVRGPQMLPKPNQNPHLRIALPALT